MHNLISAAEWARRNGYDRRSAQRCIAREKVPQAQKIGGVWLVPADLPWPDDRRHKASSK